MISSLLHSSISSYFPEKSCSSPGDVSNGRYEYQDEDILFGAVIRAVCNSGSVVVSFAIFTCEMFMRLLALCAIWGQWCYILCNINV